MIEDKVTYSDREFRAFAHLVALGSSRDGTFKDRAALAHLMGPFADMIDVLLERKDVRRSYGGRLVVAGWERYQGAKKDATAAERMRRHRAKLADNSPQSDDELGPISPSTDPVSDRERYGVTVTPRARPPISSPLGGSSPRNGNGTREDAALETFVSLTRVVEELTGVPYALRGPTSGLGERALRMAEQFGNDRTIQAFRDAASTVEHPEPGQVVIGASNLLHPIPRAGSFKAPTADEKASAEIRADIQRRLAGTTPQERN